MDSIKLFFALISIISMSSLMATTEDISVEFSDKNPFEFSYDFSQNQCIFKRNVSSDNETQFFHKWTATYDPISGGLTVEETLSSNDEHIRRSEGLTLTSFVSPVLLFLFVD